jgi:hypothetical protein
VLISLAVLMLGFAGSLYSHSPGHHHIHTTDKAPPANEHEHIQLSGDNELGIDSLLHCGADILGDTGLKGTPDSTNRSPKYDRLLRTLNAYIATRDPPPPRFLS